MGEGVEKDEYQDGKEDVLEQSASSVSVMTAEAYPHRRDIQSRLQAQQEHNRVGEDEMTWFHRALGLKGKKPTLTRTTSFMYDQCMAAAHHPDMVAVHGLDTPYSWFVRSVLHLWMPIVHLRRYGEDGAIVAQELFNNFWADLETEITKSLKNPFMLSKYMNEGFRSYHGSLIGYDQGFISDDAKLSSALWRNYFGSSDDVPIESLESMVRYVRESLFVLHSFHDVETVRLGAIAFPPIRKTDSRSAGSTTSRASFEQDL